MKVLMLVLVLVAALASAQQQLINPYFNEGLYNEWQSQLLNGYGVGPVQQLLPGQQYPQLVQQVPGPQLLPPVPVPFPAQYPFAVQQPQAQLPIQLPVPQQGLPLPVPVPPYGLLQQPIQFQMVRHGLPHSDAAAVSYSSLNYANNPQATPVTTGVTSVPSVGVTQTSSGAGVNSAASVPVAPTNPASAVVQDIATFGTEYGTGSDKSPVARYEARNAGSVHVAPLPGHTVDQKLVAPGTAEQKL